MIPKSLSASSILVSEACMARWKAENYDRTPQMVNDPAGVGSSVHFALEHFVKAVYLDKTIEWTDVQYLNDMYILGYTTTFDSTDHDTDNFRDGATLVANWYHRFREGLPHEVLSCEVKENFMVKTSVGDIPFNFIWDRADYRGDDVYEVVDYKTLRAFVRPEDLKQKIQPRAYALAAQIKWPNAKRIWVRFDMLRHDESVAVAFTREENADTWRYIKRAAERIIATDEDKVEEKVNDECKWCIRKANCDTLAKVRTGGSVLGMTLEELVERKFYLDAQTTAIKYAQEELDKAIVKEAEQREEIEFEVGDYKVDITARKTRKPNSAAIAHLVGPELSRKYGTFTVTNVEKMLKAESLGADVRQRIADEMPGTWGEPHAKITKPKDFGSAV